MTKKHQKRRGALGRAVGAFELLDARLMLAAGSLLWTDTSQMTLSFAADGTDIAGHANVLFRKFNSLAPAEEWQRAVLRAFQSWAAPTTANIGVVQERPLPEGATVAVEPVEPGLIDDDGSPDPTGNFDDSPGDNGAAPGEPDPMGFPFGTRGPRTEDPRFGDIRIGARPLSSGVAAISVSHRTMISGTWAGDVIFNSRYNFESVDQVFAVALHEAGHVFGLEHNNNPRSPMYEHSVPRYTELTRTDIQDARRVHGERVADQYEGSTGNDSQRTATEMLVPATDSFAPGSVPALIYANLHTGTDVDYFRLPMIRDYVGSIEIQVRTAGISLLAPHVTVYSSDGVVKEARHSMSVRGTSLVIPIERSSNRAEYYVQVQSARGPLDIFSVGTYSLSVSYDALLAVDPAVVDNVRVLRDHDLNQVEIQTLLHDRNNLVRDDRRTNENETGATPLEPRRGFQPFTFYQALGSISDSADTDFYRIETPHVKDAQQPVHVHVSIRSLQNGQLIPRLRVFDRQKNSPPSEILVNGEGEYVSQTRLESGTAYFIVVDAENTLADFQRGNYRLHVYFSNEKVDMQRYASGVVGDDQPAQRGHALYVARSQLFHFALDASSEKPDTIEPLSTGIVANFLNSAGETVHQVVAGAGKTRSSQSVLLVPGVYTIQVFAVSFDRQVVNPLRYQIRGTQVSDPFAVDPDDPTGDPYFECPGQEGIFCYPGGIISDDPFLWEDFLDSLPEIPDLEADELISLFLGDWWNWYWNQTGQNGPPLAIGETYSTDPDVPLSVSAAYGTLVNDPEPDGDPLTAVLMTDVSFGSLEFHLDGSFVYIPNAGFVGIDGFTYVAYDFRQESEPAQVVIEVVSSSGIPGDFDGDSVVGVNDVGLLSSAIRGMGDYVFDLNEDGMVDESDLSYLIHDILHTHFGDANLDGSFDSQDLVSIFQNGEYEDLAQLNSSWASGDWNADGEFDTKDLVVAFQDGGYLAAAIATRPLAADEYAGRFRIAPRTARR
jgi:hypothetical protein